MKDLYSILGVNKNAPQDEIKRAYRKLAMQHHPDRGGDQALFQEIQQAYDILGDAEKRQAYDNPRSHNVNINFGGHGFQDIFDIFNSGPFAGFQQHNQRRGHVRIELWITLYDVAQGGQRTVSINTGNGVSAVEINIPQGINDGDHVQYAKLAPGGQDLVVTFRIIPNNEWHRQGLDIQCRRSVVIWDLILGGELEIKDLLNSEIKARIPPRTQPGTKLRLRGRGLSNQNGQKGDILVQLDAHLPEQIPQELLEIIGRIRQ